MEKANRPRVLGGGPRDEESRHRVGRVPVGPCILVAGLLDDVVVPAVLVDVDVAGPAVDPVGGSAAVVRVAEFDP